MEAEHGGIHGFLFEDCKVIDKKCLKSFYFSNPNLNPLNYRRIKAMRCLLNQLVVCNIYEFHGNNSKCQK